MTPGSVLLHLLEPLQNPLIPTPKASGSASPSPQSTQSSADQVDSTVGNAVKQASDADWWLTHFLPIAIRVAVIVVAAMIIRAVLIKTVEKLVTKRVEHQLETAEEVLADNDREEAIEAERSAQRAQTLGSLFRNIITLVVYGFGGLLVLAEMGFDLGPLIAGAGIAGVAIGFGAQSLVADFLSGIFILMEDQYGVGDVVDVGDATGTVEEVQLRVTKIRAVDGVLWFVRNGEIVRVGNKSQNWSRTVLDITVTYGSDIQRAKEIMAQVGEEFASDSEHGDKVLETPEMWGIEDFTTDGVLLRMVVKTKPGEQWTASRILRERIKAAFDRAGIELPTTQSTVWLRRQDDEPKAAPAPVPAPAPVEPDSDAPASTKDVEVDDPKSFSDDPSGFDDAGGHSDDSGFAEPE